MEREAVVVKAVVSTEADEEEVPGEATAMADRVVVTADGKAWASQEEAMAVAVATAARAAATAVVE